MVDKRACLGLKIDQRRSIKLRATNVGKNTQQTRIALNNPAERIVAAIRLETSDHEGPRQRLLGTSASIGRAAVAPQETGCR